MSVMHNIDYFRYRIGKTHGCIIYIYSYPAKDRYFGSKDMRHKIYKNFKLGLSYAHFKMFINEAPF